MDLPFTVDEAGGIAAGFCEAMPEPMQAFFIAGFQEAIKYLQQPDVQQPPNIKYAKIIAAGLCSKDADPAEEEIFINGFLIGINYVFSNKPQMPNIINCEAIVSALVSCLATGLHDAMKQAGAENYMAFTLTDGDHPYCAIFVSLPDGKTPMQLEKEAKDKLEAFQARHEQMLKLLPKEERQEVQRILDALTDDQ